MAENTVTRVAFAEPPKFTGDLRVDLPAVVEWLWDFYNAGVLSSGFTQPADLGDLALLDTVTTIHIDDSAVTLAKIEDITDGRLLGRSAGSDGPPQEINIGANLVLAGGTLSCTATVYTDEDAIDAVMGTLTNSATITWTVSDPADTISAAVVTQMSVTSDASGVKLVNDEASPGASHRYGTDTAGAKGWHDQELDRYWFTMVNGDPVNPQFIMGFGKPIMFWKTLTEAYP